jgi:hypothetical protein
VRRARPSNKFLNELTCQRGVNLRWIWLLPFWSYLRSALVLDMRSASESLVCAADVTTKAIHQIDRIILSSTQQLRQLGDVHSNAPRFIFRQQLGR